MIVRIPGLLEPRPLAHIRERLATADWEDGRVTAGPEAAKVKRNDQLTEDHPLAKELGEIVLVALSRSPLFTSAALPLKVFPPLFNRYGGDSNRYGDHVDQAIRYAAGQRVRSDISATLFLAEPSDYDGGELVIADTFGEQRVKLAAGDLLIYPGTSVHRVEPVTRGTRLASFFWIESMVRLDEQRRLLYEMDMSLMALREQHGDSPATVQLTGTYHNLLRMWADT